MNCFGVYNPVLFHPVHADSIHISSDGTSATLTNSKQDHVYGLTFSARPIEVNEIVYLRLKPGQCPSGFIWGITNHDPAILTNYRNREIFINQDTFVRSRGGIRVITETISKEETLYFYVTHSGHIRFWFSGIGNKMGSVLLAVDAKKPMWVVFEIWGQDTYVEYVKPPKEAKILEHEMGSFYDYINACWGTKEFLPASQFRIPLVPLALYDLKNFEHVSKNNMNNLRGQVIFSARPIRPGQIIVLANWEFSGTVGIGVTCNDPSSFGSYDKPDLLQREPKTWDVISTAASDLKKDDELAVTVTEGKIHIFKYQSKKLDKVEKNLEIRSRKLWMVVIVYSMPRVKFLTTQKMQPAPHLPPCQPKIPTPAPRVLPSQSREKEVGNYQNVLPSAPSPNVLPRQIPCSHNAHNYRHKPAPSAPPAEPDSSSLEKYYQYEEEMVTKLQEQQISVKEDKPLNASNVNALVQNFSRSQNINTPPTTKNEKEELKSDSECIICYENQVDSVLNACGHMCMCHQCATRLLEIKGECPICRAKIISVIRTYK